MIMQLLCHVMSSPHIADVKEDFFRCTIYAPSVVAIYTCYILGVTEGGRIPPPPPPVVEDQKKPGLNRVNYYLGFFPEQTFAVKLCSVT